MLVYMREIYSLVNQVTLNNVYAAIVEALVGLVKIRFINLIEMAHCAGDIPNLFIVTDRSHCS